MDRTPDSGGSMDKRLTGYLGKAPPATDKARRGARAGGGRRHPRRRRRRRPRRRCRRRRAVQALHAAVRVRGRRWHGGQRAPPLLLRLRRVPVGAAGTVGAVGAVGAVVVLLLPRHALVLPSSKGGGGGSGGSSGGGGGGGCCGGVSMKPRRRRRRRPRSPARLGDPRAPGSKALHASFCPAQLPVSLRCYKWDSRSLH